MTLDDGLISTEAYMLLISPPEPTPAILIKKDRRLKKEKENNNDSALLRRWRRCFVLNNNWIREMSIIKSHNMALGIMVWTLTTISHFQFPNPYSPFPILRFSSIHFTYRTFRSGFAIIDPIPFFAFLLWSYLHH